MNKKLNIALFASAFSPSLGGVEELCRQLALELMRQGHGVIVLTNRWPRDLPATASIDGIPVYRLPFRLPEGSAKAAINYHLTHRRVERDMLGILRSHHIDMLHVQCVSSNAHYAMIAQEKLKVPLVVTLQGELTMDAHQVFQKSPQARAILRRALDKAQVITGCSGKTLRDGEEFYGKPFGDRGRVIFNGVNLADFGPSISNDQRSMSNTGDGGSSPQRHQDTKWDQELGVRSEELEGGDGGTAALRSMSNDQRSKINDDEGSSPQRHKDTKAGGGRRATEITEELGGGGGAGDPQITQITQIKDEGKNLEPGIENLEEKGRAALRYSNSYLLTPRCSPEGGSYLFALGRMAKQKGFDVLIRAYAAAAAASMRRSGAPVLNETPGEPGLMRRPAGLNEADAAASLKNNESHKTLNEAQRNVSLSAAQPNVSLSDAQRSGSLSGASHSNPAMPDFILAGEGPELENLKSLARELGLSDCVHFPGRADHAAVVRYMQGCEFFVLSSRADEGLPVVCAEAMGAGCAIVATRSGGAPEAVLDGQTGLLVDKENVEQLAAAMQRLIGDSALRARLAAAGKVRAAEFAWPVIAQQYLAAYAAAAAAAQ